MIASRDGRVVSLVGRTKTILAIVGEEIFGCGVRYNASYRRSEEFRLTEQSIKILAER